MSTLCPSSRILLGDAHTAGVVTCHVSLHLSAGRPSASWSSGWKRCACTWTSASRSWSLPSEPPRFIRAAFPHPHASSGSPGEAGGGCACSEWWQRRGGGEAVIARRCRAGCPIVGKWLHVQQRILCPCCSSVIDLTSSRGVENFKGGSGCWRSGQERRRLVVRRSASSPSPPPSGAGVKRVGVRGRALRSPQCTQSIN